jgi:hypothetical protein
MAIVESKVADRQANRDGTFSAVVLGAVGLAIISSGANGTHIASLGWALFALPSLCLCTMALLRYRRDGLLHLSLRPVAGLPRGKLVIACVMLLGTGLVLGRAMLSDSMFMLALIVAALAWAPWHRIPGQAELPAIAAGITALGVGLAYATTSKLPAPIVQLMIAWLVSIGGCAAFVRGMRLTRPGTQDVDVPGR